MYLAKIKYYNLYSNIPKGKIYKIYVPNSVNATKSKNLLKFNNTYSILIISIFNNTYRLLFNNTCVHVYVHS